MHPKPQIAGTSLFTENGTLLLTDYKWKRTKEKEVKSRNLSLKIMIQQGVLFNEDPL